MTNPTLTITIPADMLESLIHAVQLEVSYTYTQARATTSGAELPPIHERRNRLWALQDELQAMRVSEPVGES